MLDGLWTVPDYANFTLFDYGWYALWGLFGSFAFGAAANAAFELPSRDNGGWRLNAVGELASGAIMGALVANSPIHAWIAGGLAPLIIGYIVYWGTNRFTIDG